jgi:hypothetical protein
MPRISDDILECSVYLYGSKEDAERGRKTGGSGFLVYVELNHRNGRVYVVTASHVVEKLKMPSVAINGVSPDGRRQCFEIAAKHWIHHPDGHDLAAAAVAMPRGLIHRPIPMSMILTEADYAEANIGIGDEAVMVGRLVLVEGKLSNTPVLRFGRISMKPGEPIVQKDRNYGQVSFLVECNSRSGFSGSPVFVWRGANPTPADLRLLGLDWGSIVDDSSVDGRDHCGMNIKVDVPLNTGMACIVPAWHILDLLNHPVFVEQRERDAESLRKADEDGGGWLD